MDENLVLMDAECFAEIPKDCKKNLPWESSNRSGLTCYNNFSDHSFTPTQKEYFCAMSMGDVPCDKMPTTKRCLRYQIFYDTYRTWIKIYRKGGIFQTYAGCPLALADN